MGEYSSKVPRLRVFVPCAPYCCCRYLLYLSTVAESDSAAATDGRADRSAAGALQPAVQVLLQSDGLQPLAAAAKQPGLASAPASASAGMTASASAGVTAGPGGAVLQAHQGAIGGVTEAPASGAQAPASAVKPATKEATAAASADARPRALQVRCYSRARCTPRAACEETLTLSQPFAAHCLCVR